MGKHKSNAPKVNLVEAGDVINVDSDYDIRIDSGDFIIVKAGVLLGKPAAGFSHPNVAKKTKELLAFRRYFPNGGKKWYEKAGVNYFFIVPKSAINVFVDKGYSFVDAEINGVNVTFNVTGGAGGDHIGRQAEIFVNHSARDLKKIAEVSIRDPEIEKTIIAKEMDDCEKKRWAQMSAKKSPNLVKTLVRMMEDGENPVIKVAEGFNVLGYEDLDGTLYDVSRRKIRVNRYDGNKNKVGWSYDYRSGPVKAFAIKTDIGTVRVLMSQVDWVETAKLNGISVQ